MSVKVDETIYVSTKEHLSVIVRLAKQDRIVERFLKSRASVKV